MRFPLANTWLVAMALLCSAAAQDNLSPAKIVSAPMLVQHVTFVGGEHVPAMDREKFARDLEGTARIAELRQKVADFWHNYGFYRVNVEAEPRMSSNKWGEAVGEVTFRITEGPQYRLEEVRWTGATAFTPAQLNSIFPVKAGDVFDTSEIRRGMGAIRQAYAQKGYLQIAAVPAMQVNDVEHTITLGLQIREGERRASQQ